MKHYEKILLTLLLTLVSLPLGAESRFTEADITKLTDAATYIVRNKPSGAAMDSILAELPKMTLADALPLINDSMKLPYTAKIIDAIYMTDNLRNGYSLEEARDAISFTIYFPFRRPNSHDIRKLTDVFNSPSPILHRAYLAKMAFVFRNCGAMDELMALRDLIIEKTADSPEKTEALNVFEGYAPLADGKPAPKIELFDENGNARSFEDYAGKTIVVDAWATWCHNCLKKMPAYIALRDSYANDDRVVFLTVSIDRKPNRERWLSMSKKQSINGSDNLIVESDDTSEFENIYKVGGVPRYIVIAPDGTFADAFAPGPGDELKRLIDTTLEKSSK